MRAPIGTLAPKTWSLKAEAGRWQITEIDLSNNHIEGWPMNMLSQLPALTTLDATDNPLACVPENRSAGLLIPSAQFDSIPECAVSLVRLMLHPETLRI
jgi:hypothetical protein